MHSFTLGHLGAAGPICRDTTVASGRISLQCNTGTIQEIKDFGITPEGSKVLDPCLRNNETALCEPYYD